MSTIRDIPVPINGQTTLVTGRYPGGQLSLSSCDAQVLRGTTITSKVTQNDPFDDWELVFKDKHDALSALRAAGVIGARPIRTIEGAKPKDVYEVYEMLPGARHLG